MNKDQYGSIRINKGSIRINKDQYGLMRDQGGINKGEGNSDWKKPYADSPASLWPQRGEGHVHFDCKKQYVLGGVRVAIVVFWDGGLLPVTRGAA